MYKSILEKYAHLLVNYCISIAPGDRVYISSTILAEPLIKEVYKACLINGGIPFVDFQFRGQETILNRLGNREQLSAFSPTYIEAMQEYDGYINIRAPYNLSETSENNKDNETIRSQAGAPYRKAYFDRTATLEMKRTLCQFPTDAAAQMAGMSLDAYENFVYEACRLFDESPIESWKAVSARQQQYVDVLNQYSEIRYKSSGTDIFFSTHERKWINSDGKTNMPSGEVYTSPVESSVNGRIHFSYPGFYMGREVEGVTLVVKDGEVVEWEAKKGRDFLDYIFGLPGAKIFGEAAIGLNENIRRMTKNILFDEKTGGTVHMALGQSYQQAGGKNESPIHWDMITDMSQTGEIYGDGKLIFRKGQFVY